MSPPAAYSREDDIADQMVSGNPNEDFFLEEIGNRLDGGGSPRGNEDLQSNVVIEEQDQLPTLSTNDGQAISMVESDEDQSRNGALDMIGYYCDTNDTQSSTGVEETAVQDIYRKVNTAVRTPRTRSTTRLRKSFGKRICVLDGVLNKIPWKKKNQKSNGPKKSGKPNKFSKDNFSWGSRVRELHPKTE